MGSHRFNLSREVLGLVVFIFFIILLCHRDPISGLTTALGVALAMSDLLLCVNIRPTNVVEFKSPASLLLHDHVM
jgi:multisubunit Na+/H+ antiporter MnhB subunit